MAMKLGDRGYRLLCCFAFAQTTTYLKAHKVFQVRRDIIPVVEFVVEFCADHTKGYQAGSAGSTLTKELR